MGALVIILGVFSLLACPSTASPGFGGHVTVLKCCPYGETLDPHTADSPACMRTDNDASSSRWTPKIYSRKKQAFLPSDGTPAHWTVHAASRPPCGERAHMVLAHPQNLPTYVLFEEGSLYVKESSELLPPGRFCVDATAALVCPAKEEDPVSVPPVTNAISDGPQIKKKPRKPRIRKCCDLDAVYSEAEASCVAKTVSSSESDFWASLGDTLQDAFTPLTGFPACGKPGYAVRGHLGASSHEARLESDGTVRLESAEPLRPEDYCLESILELGGVGVAVLACPGEDAAAAPANNRDDIRFTLYPALLFLSVFFLAATLLACHLIPAAYHQLHWRCQTNYVASLMLGDLLLAITQVSGPALKGPFCVVFAILMHFLFLAAFFWLNTMCFNIWWTFRDLRPASVDKGQESMRMRLYQVYAWGGPLVIAGIAAALDQLPAEQYPHVLRPGFGQDKCWFLGDMEMLPYFFGPLGVLLFVNLCLFIATARELTCGLWKADGAKPTTERATLRRVCLKLVVVMGVTWVADVVSWAAGGPAAVWYATDLVNALQGVLIFAVVGCQPHVWAAVKRLWCLRESRSEASRREHQSSTSQGPHSLGPDSFTTTTATTGAGAGAGASPPKSPPPNSETPC